MHINTYFDKIYLLNLFRRPDRLAQSKSRLDLIGIDYQVFNGVDGSVMNFVWKKVGNEYFTNPAYLACSISHLSIYQDALSRGYEKILIIEDDNMINKNIMGIFDEFNIPEWSDLLYLGYIPLNDDCSMWDYNRYGINSENSISDRIFSPKNLWGLFAYGIRRSLMEEMINIYNLEFPMEIDRYFVQKIQTRGRSLAVVPQIFCCQDGVHSDNLGFAPPGMMQKSVDVRFAKLEDYI